MANMQLHLANQHTTRQVIFFYNCVKFVKILVEENCDIDALKSLCI